MEKGAGFYKYKESKISANLVLHVKRQTVFAIIIFTASGFYQTKKNHVNLVSVLNLKHKFMRSFTYINFDLSTSSRNKFCSKVQQRAILNFTHFGYVDSVFYTKEMCYHFYTEKQYTLL